MRYNYRSSNNNENSLACNNCVLKFSSALILFSELRIMPLKFLILMANLLTFFYSFFGIMIGVSGFFSWRHEKPDESALLIGLPLAVSILSVILFFNVSFNILLYLFYIK